MSKVNSEIQRAIRQKEAKIITGTVMMENILKALQKEVLHDLGEAAIGSWDTYKLKQMVNSLERHIADYERGGKTAIAGLLDNADELGAEMIAGAFSAAGEISTGFGISTSSLETMKDFTFHKIKDVSKSAFDKIRSELTMGIVGGKSPQEVATAIGRDLDSPSIFRTIKLRAETITKVEMGRAFSTAAQERMSTASEYVPGLEKKWLHSGHPLVARATHLAAHGRHVPVNKPFKIGAVSMMYPRDPAAPVKEVIHCGCEHVPYHPNWAN